MSRPLIGPLGVDDIRSSRGRDHAMRNSPITAPTPRYHFEYGTDTTTAADRVPACARSFQPTSVDGSIGGLQPDTTYHVRVVANNSAGTSYRDDRVFKTYPISSGRRR